MRLINADVFRDRINRYPPEIRDIAKKELRYTPTVAEITTMPVEQKKDLIQKFHDYQVEWLKSHYDIELEPVLEELIIRFLHDTANCFMMELDRGEQE